MKVGDDAHIDVGAYVLHALPPDEEAAFENHLASCADCRREADELTGTASLLGAAEARTPSPELRHRVLGQISAVRQERPEHPEPSKRHRRRRRALRLALAASLAAAAALGGVAWWQHTEADSAQEEATDAHSGAEALADVLAAPDATISTAELTHGATASVIASRTRGRAAFVASDLPPLTDGQVYELWYARAGTFRPAGLLSGTGGRQAYVLDGPLEGATAVGITVEPAGGSQQPTTDPLGLVSVPV
ncbi:anti-sigma factor domain-containing protein [Streptomyces sp. AC512_CC834]|uniref:anti-sigma factor n=1 Tax=Streptomyces sp. AC512_CC834 TaxID=2823691 RepID=UPI001C25AD1A|nr:anti-sigma factor [Streptomyces sp. AC512_CC834]